MLRIADVLPDMCFDAEPAEAMGALIDALWSRRESARVSWAGFYHLQRGAREGEELVLGVSCPKPACSPISLSGACGRALTTRSTLVVGDVASLGEGYIACDPLDRSELVVPLIRDGACSCVLDLDSHELGAFTGADADALHGWLSAHGLTEPRPPAVVVL